MFAEGRGLMEAERYEEACPKFEESLRLDHGMGTQFNLAHCWEKIGRTASAWALFLDVAAAARAAGQAPREQVARERAKALEPKLTRLRIAVPEPTPDMKVSRDDQDVRRAAWGTAMPIDPGDHAITVTAPGKQAWSQQLTLPATSRIFSVIVPALEDAVAAKSQDDGSPAPAATPRRPVNTSSEAAMEGEGSNGQSIAALVIGGVGIATLAAGTIFAIQSRSDNAEALKLCRIQTPEGDSCGDEAERARHDELIDDAERGQLLGYIGIGIGSAALITATVLYATAGSGSDRAGSALNVTPLWNAEGWGAALSGRF